MWGKAPISYEIVTNKVGDPQWRGPAGAALASWFRTQMPTTLVVKVEEDHWAVNSQAYEAEVKLNDSSDWQQIVLPAGSFRTKDAKPLGNWDLVDRLAFVGESPPLHPPMLGRVEWLPGAHQP